MVGRVRNVAGDGIPRRERWTVEFIEKRLLGEQVGRKRRVTEIERGGREEIETET